MGIEVDYHLDRYTEEKDYIRHTFSFKFVAFVTEY